MVADLPTLKRRFVRALDKRTERETVSLRTRIRNAQDGDKRDVFDDGLLLWADSLAECTAEYAGHFCSIPKTQRPEDCQDWAEEQAWAGLGDFLGVNFTTEPSQWPEQNRVHQFILEACPSGPQLPKWFDLGLMQISRIRVKEEIVRMEATADLDAAIKRVDTRLARLDEKRTEKQKGKARAGAWDNLIPTVLADSDNEPQPVPRLSEDDSARLVQAVYDRFAKLLFGDLAFGDLALELDSGGVSVLAEGTVPSKGEASESGNAFIRSATGWIVRYKGNEKAFSDKVGFSMIQLALKNAGAALWPNEVERLCGPEVAVADVSTEDRGAMLKASTEQEFGDLAYIKELLKEVQSYDKKIRDATGSPEAAMLEQERDEKRSFLEKLTKPGGARRKLGSDEGRSAKRVSTNVTRAVAEITRHIPDLGKHLSAFLKAGVQVIYLDKSTTWQFK